jgi:hypothetical protein
MCMRTTAASASLPVRLNSPSFLMSFVDIFNLQSRGK